jgi:predicted nucleotidyltransferase
MGKAKIEEVVKDFKKKVAKEFFVQEIIIFGSAARGKMTRDSDVDLIVVSKKFGRKNTFEITPKLYGVWHSRKNYPVDILLFNTKEFDRLKKEVSIVSEALKEGIVI